MTKVHQIVVAALTVLLATPILAETTAFVGAHIIPVDGPEIPDGTLIVVDGVIKSVGPRAEVKLPNEAITIDAAGMHIMPGLVDTHSHIGGSRAADQSGPIQPGVRISDGLNVFDAGFRRALAGGLTTINVMPGSGYLSSGQTIYLKLRRTGIGSGVTAPKDMAYLTEDGRLLGGLKMANGTNSRGQSPFPGTRAKAVYLVREKFIHAQEYAAKIEAADGDESKLPPRDLDLESLVEVLRGERVVHHHTHRSPGLETLHHHHKRPALGNHRYTELLSRRSQNGIQSSIVQRSAHDGYRRKSRPYRQSPQLPVAEVHRQPDDAETNGEADGESPKVLCGWPLKLQRAARKQLALVEPVWLRVAFLHCRPVADRVGIDRRFHFHVQPVECLLAIRLGH